MNVRRIATTASLCAAIVIAGVTAAQAVGSSPAAPAHVLGHAAHMTRTATTDNACGYVAAIPSDSFKGIPTYDKTHPVQPYTVSLHTTQGTISFRALTTAAPCTTYSFRFLAERHFYDRTHCHRLTTQGIYVLQCGDPTGTGSGAPGYQFNDENLKGATYPAGTVAMANAGPNTNGSQFFFVWKDTTLSPAYTPFGVVTGGMSVLRRIAAAGDDSQNGPGDGYPHLYVGIHAVTFHTGR